MSLASASDPETGRGSGFGISFALATFAFIILGQPPGVTGVYGSSRSRMTNGPPGVTGVYGGIAWYSPPVVTGVYGAVIRPENR